MTTVGSRHRSLRDETVDELRRLILNGQLPAGSRITEATIVERLGVSRVPVREAFRRLEAEGLLTANPRRGVTVTALDANELAVVREVRVALELMAVRKTIARLDSVMRREFQDMFTLGQAAADAGDTPALDAANEDFHDLVATSSGSRFLAETLRAARNKAHHLIGGKSASVDQSWDEHAAVIRAILDNDSDYAELLMRRHLDARHVNQGGVRPTSD